MADGRYFEIVNAPHISQKVSDFDEIWCAEVNSDKDDSHFTEIQLFQKKYYLCRDNACRRAPPSVVPIGLWGAEEGEIKTQFSSAASSAVAYVGHRPAHILA